MRHLLPLVLLVLLALPAPAADPDAPPTGVLTAAAVPGSPKLTAAGMAWWRGKLVVADRGGKRLVAHTPPDRFEPLRDVSGTPVGLAADPDGHLVLTERDPPRVVRIKADGTTDVIADADVGTPQFVAVHKSGRVFWTGFPDAGVRSVVPGGTVSVLAPRVGHSYGVAVSPKGDALYVSSKLPNKELRAVWRFPLAADGTPGRGEVFFKTPDLKVELPGLPAATDGATDLSGWVGRLQGLAVDRLGHVYVAGAEAHTSGEAVAAVTPDGKAVAALVLGVPRNVSGLAFGGADGRTLYVTGAGAYPLYQVRVPAAGVGW